MSVGPSLGLSREKVRLDLIPVLFSQKLVPFMLTQDRIVDIRTREREKKFF